MKKRNRADTTVMKVEITEEVKDMAKNYAKDRGLSLQWWIASLIKKELKIK